MSNRYPVGLAELAVGNVISLDEVNGEPTENEDGEVVVIVYGDKDGSLNDEGDPEEWEIEGYGTEIAGPRNDVAKFWCTPLGDDKFRLSRGRPMDSSNWDDPFGESVYAEDTDGQQEADTT